MPAEMHARIVLGRLRQPDLSPQLPEHVRDEARAFRSWVRHHSDLISLRVRSRWYDDRTEPWQILGRLILLLAIAMILPALVVGTIAALTIQAARLTEPYPGLVFDLGILATLGLTILAWFGTSRFRTRPGERLPGPVDLPAPPGGDPLYDRWLDG